MTLIISGKDAVDNSTLQRAKRAEKIAAAKMVIRTLEVDPLYDKVAREEGLEMWTLPRRRAPPVPISGGLTLNRKIPAYASLRKDVGSGEGRVKGLAARFEVKNRGGLRIRCWGRKRVKKVDGQFRNVSDFAFMTLVLIKNLLIKGGNVCKLNFESALVIV